MREKFFQKISICCKTFSPFGIWMMRQKKGRCHTLPQHALFKMHEEKDDDRELVERARTGDREAFGELVSRYRAKAYGWARSIAHDPHLADDIVQDALIRAFMHLGTLLDGDRFIPWLQTIVRNQAYMKLRRGGPFGKEKPFSSFEVTSRKQKDVNWSDLDSILHHLAARHAEAPEEGDPEKRVMRNDILELIRTLLRCLKPREREIFELHFFRHLSPSEIASLYATTTNVIYTSLHRSKQKMQKEHLRACLDHFVKTRKGIASMSKKILEKPVMYHYEGTYNSAVLAMHSALKYTDKHELSLAEVMAFTTHAFRINVSDSIDPSGPTAFDWKRVFSQGLKNLGFTSKSVGAPTGHAPSAEEVVKAIELVHDSIDRGIPLIAWNVEVPEFGLIYGYDDSKKRLHIFDAAAPGKELPYEKLGHGSYPELFVLAIGERTEKTHRTADIIHYTPQMAEQAANYRNALRSMLEQVLQHARGEEATLPNMTCGLAAYDVFLNALQAGTVHEFGGGYNIAVISDARKFAAEFLIKLSRPFHHCLQLNMDEFRLQRIAARAAVHYAEVSAAWLGLSQLFPFPQGSIPKDPAVMQEAIELLKKAKEAEGKGVTALEELYDTLSVTKSEVEA
jgi:RNA polymerase sigma factor (sigma-70 family)